MNNNFFRIFKKFSNYFEDRDTFININWANVNPQNYDIFARSDLVKYTSYGVPYDYGWILKKL